MNRPTRGRRHGRTIALVRMRIRVRGASSVPRKRAPRMVSIAYRCCSASRQRSFRRASSANAPAMAANTPPLAINQRAVEIARCLHRVLLRIGEGQHEVMRLGFAVVPGRCPDFLQRIRMVVGELPVLIGIDRHFAVLVGHEFEVPARIAGILDGLPPPALRVPCRAG